MSSRENLADYVCQGCIGVNLDLGRGKAGGLLRYIPPGKAKGFFIIFSVLFIIYLYLFPRLNA